MTPGPNPVGGGRLGEGAWSPRPTAAGERLAREAAGSPYLMSRAVGTPAASARLMSARRGPNPKPRGLIGRTLDALTPELDPRGPIGDPGERAMRAGQGALHGGDFAPRQVPPPREPSRAAEPRSSLPRSEPAQGAAPNAPPARGASEAGPTPAPSGFSLDRFLYAPEGGSLPLAVTILGAAEGTRNLDGSPKAAYRGHTDPGNGKTNRGSFSYQDQKVASPEEADRLQLQALAGTRAAYEKAARDAGLDPNDPLLATTYFDVFTQSKRAAEEFRKRLGLLRGAGFQRTA
jgi:hypothetical protein